MDLSQSPARWQLILEQFKHMFTHPLLYEGDCKLLGVTPDDTIYAEELYGEDDWLAQHRLSLDTGILESVDEAWGNNLKLDLLVLPDTLIRSQSVRGCHQLDFSGARLRGMRADERIDELLLPLEVSEKIELIDYMEWDITPMQLLGIAESVVLAETKSPLVDVWIVCRRLRLAYTTTEMQVEGDMRYDYDTLPLYLVHEYNVATRDSPTLLDCLDSIDDVLLLRPMDCLYHAARLYIADGGEDEDASAIHIFELQSSED